MSTLKPAALESTFEIDSDSKGPSIIIDSENKSSAPGNSVQLTPRLVTTCLSLIIVLLIFAHVLAIYLENNLPEVSKVRRVLVQYFHFGLEANFPTYFSALLLLLSSIISFCIFRLDISGTNKKNARYWLTLSLIFLFLSADEAVQIHEQLMSVTHYLIPNLSSILSSAWVIPYAVIALVVGIYFLRFVFRFPRKTRNLIALAGVTFLTGALGLEIAETYLHGEFGVTHILFILNMLVQEMLEMIGIVIFVYALLDYISSHYRGLLIKIK